MPLSWKKGRTIFVNSMSDLFHEQVPDEYILRVFEVMGAALQHRFQILTKRHARFQVLAPFLNWTPNIWMGVSVETNRWGERIAALRDSPAAVKFLSCEPLLGPLDIKSAWGRLGNRRGGREWTQGQTHARGVGPRYKGSVSTSWRSILFQAVGRI